MENKVKMTFDGVYVAPDVQVTEVLVEQGFQLSLENDPMKLEYGGDFEDFAY